MDKKEIVKKNHKLWLAQCELAPVGWFFDNPKLITAEIRERAEEYHIILPEEDE